MRAAFLVVASCGFTPTITDASAPADARPPDLHLRIATLIDGESHFLVKGTTVHWQHFTFAAPGRWNGATVPTTLNGVAWQPVWPDVPTAENRDCNGCTSSTTELPIGVPRAPSTTTWTEVQTRRAQGIVQYPSAANDWELVVLISDQSVSGAADYIVDIDVKVD